MFYFFFYFKNKGITISGKSKINILDELEIKPSLKFIKMYSITLLICNDLSVFLEHGQFLESSPEGNE